MQEAKTPIHQLGIYHQHTLKAAILSATTQLNINIAEVKQKGTRYAHGEFLLEKYYDQLQKINNINLKEPISAISNETLTYLFEHLRYLDMSSSFLLNVISKLKHERDIDEKK